MLLSDPENRSVQVVTEFALCKITIKTTFYGIDKMVLHLLTHLCIAYDFAIEFVNCFFFFFWMRFCLKVLGPRPPWSERYICFCYEYNFIFSLLPLTIINVSSIISSYLNLCLFVCFFFFLFFLIWWTLFLKIIYVSSTISSSTCIVFWLCTFFGKWWRMANPYKYITLLCLKYRCPCFALISSMI